MSGRTENGGGPKVGRIRDEEITVRWTYALGSSTT